MGKAVKDIYGRRIGQVVGLIVDTKNRVEAIEVELGSGEFVAIPCYQVAIEGSSIIRIPTWRVEVEDFHKEADAVQQRLIALDELLDAGEITQSLYDELRKDHESIMKSLEDRKKGLIESLKRKASDLDQQLKSLERILATTKMLHRAGQISESTYKVSIEYIIQGLSHVKAEKKDLEAHLNELLSVKKPEPPVPAVSEDKVLSITREEEAVGSPQEAEHVSPPPQPEVLRVKVIDEGAE